MPLRGSSKMRVVAKSITLFTIEERKTHLECQVPWMMEEADVRCG